MKRPPVRCFELAVWFEEKLCGLAFGPGSDRWIGLEYLEARPTPHPLKGQILDISLAVLEVQALASGVGEARLLGPDRRLVQIYRQRGYTARGGTVGSVVSYQADQDGAAVKRENSRSGTMRSGIMPRRRLAIPAVSSPGQTQDAIPDPEFRHLAQERLAALPPGFTDWIGTLAEPDDEPEVVGPRVRE